MSVKERLLKLPAEEAVDLKFRLGRLVHGEVWTGDRPIVECHEEILDALAYVREELLGRTGHFPGKALDEQVLFELYRNLLNVLQGVRVLIDASDAFREGEAHGPQERAEEGGGEGPGQEDDPGGDRPVVS